MKIVTLGEICSQITDGTHHTPTYTEKGIPFLRVTDITGSNESKKFISENEHRQLIKRCNPEKGDILYTKNGTIGVAKEIDWDFEFSIFVSLCLLKANPNFVFNRYLVHYLNTNFALRQATQNSKKATISNLHLIEIKKIKIPLPPLPTQKKIAAILDEADKLRQQSKQLIENYNQLTQSLFLDMFGDPVTNPKGYPISSVGEQCNVKGGKRVPKGEKLIKEDTGYPYIKAGNIKNGKVTLKNLEYLNYETREKIKRYTVEKGDVCITVVGINIGDIGIVPAELDKANLTENANKLLIKDKCRLNGIYLTLALQSDYIQKQIHKKTMAVGVPKLALFRIQELLILLPPINLQNQFAERLQAIEAQKAQAQQELAKAEDLFNSLLQRAFKGELVKD
ncbi:restriction endonuclease subunit S [Fulvivirga sediminis]|uniref:Restriction endonuclease subunit S n=1 Tax=Fulvivirga sediminis TaxID=2803949 RepID=A0A937F8V3_9BACT|nr:restriction endonuclease subunit S [Fulvivirga sediminis]MBL3657157.1 restriction endonuclease subunit S [Fulvivirga sediminis]